MTTFKFPPILILSKTGGIYFLEILVIPIFLFSIIFITGEKMENLYTAAEVVRITKKSRKTIDNYLNSGKLSYTSQGGRKMIHVDELLRIFPYVKIEDLEQSPLPHNSTQTQKLEFSGQELEILKLKNKISILEQELDFQKKLLRVYEAQIESLRTDKERQEAHFQEYTAVVDLLRRGLPAPAAKVRKAVTDSPTPARDAKGRFVPRGAASLFESESSS